MRPTYSLGWVTVIACPHCGTAQIPIVQGDLKGLPAMWSERALLPDEKVVGVDCPQCHKLIALTLGQLPPLYRKSNFEDQT